MLSQALYFRLKVACRDQTSNKLREIALNRNIDLNYSNLELSKISFLNLNKPKFVDFPVMLRNQMEFKKYKRVSIQ